MGDQIGSLAHSIQVFEINTPYGQRRLECDIHFYYGIACCFSTLVVQVDINYQKAHSRRKGYLYSSFRRVKS
jgi:hypothetical protein